MVMTKISKNNNQEIYQNLNKRKYLLFSDIKQYPELISLGHHLNTNNVRQILYHALNQIDKIPLCKCGNKLSWHADRREYRVYCSKKCSSTYSVSQRKETSVKKYGVEHYSKTKEFVKKVRNTSIEKYGVNHYSKTSEFHERVKNTNIEKYGTSHPFKNQNILNQTKQQWLLKYGVDNPSKLESIKEKIINTNLQRYGTTCSLLSSEVKEKIKKTNIEKYGFENAMSNSDIASKAGNSRKLEYYSTEILERLNDPAWLESKNKAGQTVGEISKELGISSSNLCKYFDKYKIPIIRHFSSSEERCITDYLDNIEIDYVKNNRKIIYPYELDIFIPKINLAIEINGGYWHNEGQGKDKFYHLNKLSMCKEKGIELWQFFDWEVNKNFDIIISKIRQKLKQNEKIFARTLKVEEINTQTKSIFLNENHLQGDCISKINLGLTDQNGKLYALMTFGKSRFNKKYGWELLRFCCLKNTSVTGAAGKLLSYFLKNIKEKNETVISYCNLRWSSGHLYSALGFTLVHQSPPNYFYVTKNGQYAGTRNQWQKHTLKSKLVNFDENKSEIANMNNHGYQRIWDCGQLLFVFTENR